MVAARQISLTIGEMPPTLAPRKVASTSPATTTYFQSVRNAGAVYTGYVNYVGLGVPTAWDTEDSTFAAAYGTEDFEYQKTCKTHDDAGLTTFLTNLPDPWRPFFKYNIYQEPEDNLTTAPQRAAWKADYASAAAVINSWNSAHPTKTVDLPWVELKEFGADRLYNHSDGSQSPGLFVPASGDFRGVLWSLFEYGEPAGTTFDATTIDANVAFHIGNVTHAMSDFFPGKPWGLMAGGYVLEPDVGPWTTGQKQNQARWLTQMYAQTQAAGSTNWAWYNVNFPGSGGANGENRVEIIAQTLTAFEALP